MLTITGTSFKFKLKDVIKAIMIMVPNVNHSFEYT